MSNRVTILAHNGWKGYYYFMLFPLDLFGPDTDERLMYQQTKVQELVPIFGWLVPLLVLSSGTAHMGIFGLLVFLSLESFLLAFISKFHLKLQWNQVVDIWLNLWLSMTGLALSLGILALVFGGLANPEIDWD